MSTDYGFRCRECGISKIIDNCRAYLVPKLSDVLDKADHLIVAIDVGAEIVLESLGDVTPEVRFIVDHRAQGHTVVVADECGCEWGQCVKRGHCDHCGEDYPCSLALNHDGPCQPRTKVTP